MPTSPSPLPTNIAAGSSSHHTSWHPLARFGFCFAFCWLLLNVAVVFQPFQVVPGLGALTAKALHVLFASPVEWVGQHVFHLSGVAAHWHETDSRDEALDWVMAAYITAVSLLVAVFWICIDRKRKDYRSVGVWLRLLLRLSLVFLMFRYGLFKVFPLQMAPPSLAVLNEPMGNSSPMTLLWTLIGLNPAYETLCGAIEVTAAVLLFFRRTALMGALLNAFVMTNVLVFNLFFDVPVKLGAALILLFTLAVIAPDLPSLVNFFWRRQPDAPVSAWAPSPVKRVPRLAVGAAEYGFLALTLYALVPAFYQADKQQANNLRHPSALAGEWHVESSTIRTSNGTVDAPVLTAEGAPMTELFVEPDGRAMARSTDGRLWRAQASVDLAHSRFTLGSGYFEGTRFQGTYALKRPDANHLVLTPAGASAGQLSDLSLTRVPLPATYPLLERKFHWVNEWALER